MFCYSDIKNVYYKITEVFDEMNIKPKFNTRFMHSRKTLAVVSLLFMIALLSSPFISEFSRVAPFASAAPDVEDVNTWAKLKAAVDAAPTDRTPYVIEISGAMLYLEDTITISEGQNITLIHKGNSRRLLGVEGKATITVQKDGELVLDGVIITHDAGTKGTGVYINAGGNFTMLSGQIADNNVTGDGGGVANYGYFTLVGGTIQNNNARNGGGVYSDGTSFRMTGGQISNNAATQEGGGISTYNDFTMTDGRINNNKANVGGGVAIYDCKFTLSGGSISFNSANNNGGGVYSSGNMYLSNDNTMIFNNTATNEGGGVFSDGELFNMDRGAVSNNTARDGGGIYVNNGDFVMIRGTIANNTARRNGGGIGVPGLISLEYFDIRAAAVFSNNRAATAYDRAPAHDDMYGNTIRNGVTWSFNFKQGYNNYDIQYTAGTRIENPEASPSPSATATASPTPTSTSTPGVTKTPTPTPTTPPIEDSYFWVIVALIILVACLIIALMFFYFKKNATQQGTPDWIDSTPPPSPADYSNSAIV